MNGSVWLAALLWMALGIITPARGFVHYTPQDRLVPRSQIKGAVVPLMSSSTWRLIATHLPSARTNTMKMKMKQKMKHTTSTSTSATTTKLFSDMSNNNNNANNTLSSDASTSMSTCSKSQSLYAMSYRAISAAYLLQVVVLIIRKANNNGVVVTLMDMTNVNVNVNVAGGQFLASGVAYLLATAASHNRFSHDTTKQLNGLLVLYSFLGCICMLLALGGPQLLLCDTFYDWLLCLGTSGGALCVSVLGYVKGVRATQGNTTFVAETRRLTTEAQQTTLAMMPPKNVAAMAYSCALAVIAARKGLICFEIMFQLLVVSWSSSSSIAMVAVQKLSRLATLTIMGGTTVILKDAAHRGRLHLATFWCLNLVSSMVFGGTAGTFRCKRL